MGLADALDPAAQSFPVQDPYQGLAASTQQLPDMEAPLPKDENEIQSRKAGWMQVFDEFNKNPALQNALLVTGLSLMRPGSNIGDAGLAGFATYNESLMAGDQQKARQLEMQRLQGQERRAESAEQRAVSRESRDTALSQLQQQREQLNLDWMSKTKPLEVKKLEAEIARIPGEAEQAQLALKLKRLELEQQPEKAKLELERIRAQIAASNRQGEAAIRKTDQERAIEALRNLPEFKDLPEAEKNARATERFYSTSRWGGVERKSENETEKAIAFADYVDANRDNPEVQLALMDSANISLYAQGANARKAKAGVAPAGGGSAPPASAPTGASAPAPQRRVITAAEIRQRAAQGTREASGPIREGN